jgi:threonylcarbamoyladenosine tRNA methylthiotransferase MtaB
MERNGPRATLGGLLLQARRPFVLWHSAFGMVSGIGAPRPRRQLRNTPMGSRMKAATTPRFFVQNFGCRATQADGASLSADLARRGLAPAGDAARADVVILNTCTVTSEADQDARQAIRRIHRENPQAEILVTGCYAQRSPEQLSRIPGVKWVVGNSHKTLIGEILAPPHTAAGVPDTSGALVQIRALPQHDRLAYHGEIAAGGTLVGEFSAQAGFFAEPVVEAGLDRTRPNLKIQDGCSNRCTFCIIPSVRGPSRSAPAARVIEQIGDLAGRYVEVVITGINLGRWGRDLPGRPRLADLLRRLLAETSVRRLRLSSVEPMDWTNDLLDMMAASERIAKHVHIPLQSGSDAVLRAMHRRYRARHYAGRLERARAAMPWAAIGADVMVGFPAETDGDFEATRSFVERMPFTYLHVFSYSQREGTPAAAMGGQIPKAVQKHRNRVLRELVAEKNLRFRRSLLGRQFSAVALDRNEGARSVALTDNYLHVEIDGPAIEPGESVRVELVGAAAGKTLARLV